MKKQKKLIWQLFPPYLFILLVSLTAVTWYASSALREFHLDHTASDLEARARLLTSSLVEHISPIRPDRLDRLCKKTGRPASTRITVILPSGEVAADSIDNPSKMVNHGDRPEVIQAYQGKVGTAIRHSQTLDQRMMYVAMPLKVDDSILAVLRTSAPMTSIEGRIRSIQTKFIVGGFLIALLAAGVSLYMSRRISRPIEEMKKSAVRFAEGNLSHRMMVPDTLEIAALAEALNRMARGLENRIETVNRQRKELAAVLSSMSEGLIAVDREEKIVNVNPAASRMFEVDLSSARGRVVGEMIRRQGLREFLTEAMAGSGSRRRDIVIHQSGGDLILNAHASPILGTDKEERIGTLMVFNDFTELRRLEAVRQDFVANVSHEIKTPLTAIKGFVETLDEGVEDPGESRRFLKIILRHADRLSAIVEDLLTLSRLEGDRGRESIQVKKTRVKNMIQIAMQVCLSVAEDNGVAMSLSCPADLTVMVDETLFEQALINLIDNAVKYGGRGSKVEIDATAKNAGVVIGIRDQGPGVPKKHLPRLFERFYRVDKARSRRMGGTGLGLSIVKHIVQVHGGWVKVESDIGKGSLFSIHLPGGGAREA